MAIKTPTGKTVSVTQLQSLYKKWENGSSKASLEQRVGVAGAKGKWISRAWFKELGINTGNSVLA